MNVWQTSIQTKQSINCQSCGNGKYCMEPTFLSKLNKKTQHVLQMHNSLTNVCFSNTKPHLHTDAFCFSSTKHDYQTNTHSIFLIHHASEIQSYKYRQKKNHMTFGTVFLPYSCFSHQYPEYFALCSSGLSSLSHRMNCYLN